MDKETTYAQSPSRHQSMLPHKTNVKPLSRVTGSFLDQDRYEAAGCNDAGGRQFSAVSKTSQTVQDKATTMPPPGKLLAYASMRPPASVGQTNLKRDSAKIGHFPRQSSSSRKSSRDSSDHGACPSQGLKDLSKPCPPIRTSSGDLDPRSNAKGSYQGRSLSQQVRPTAAPELLPSKTFPQRQSFVKHPRPAFSAMQQHFSPKKSIQPDAADLSSQTASKGEIPSIGAFQLQMELAQLHLLHRSSLFVQSEWEKSAKELFEHQFNALYERHTELKEVAQQQQSLINQLSLVEWAQGRSGAQISESVLLLSHKISDICSLLDPDGKYTHILEVFESWFAQALRVREQRESGTQQIGRKLDFIEGIGDGWKAEAMVLEREMTYSARDLKSFREVRSASDLCRVLSMYRKLMIGLLEELDLIQWIENEMMTRESSWIESTIHNLASNVSKDVGSMDPSWKAV